MTDSRTTLTEGVYLARLVESAVETSALDRRHDFIPAPRPRIVVMRSTTDTQFVVTSAIDLRDDVVRDEVPSIVGDACHGVLGADRDAIVQAIEQDDTRPMRRLATGTTPPSIDDAMRAAVARRDTAAIRAALDLAVAPRDAAVATVRAEDDRDDMSEPLGADDALTVALARGSSPSRDGAVAFARGSSSSLDNAASIARASTSSVDSAVSISRGRFVPMARGASQAEPAVTRMTMSRDDRGGRDER